MHSSEIPITEWWDPAWEIYDVPSIPQRSLDPDPEVRISDSSNWWAAYDHNATVAHIMTGHRWYGPDNLYAHQLTTGYDEAERLIEFTRNTLGEPLEPWQERLMRAYFAPEVVRCECWPLVTRLGEPPEVEQNPDCRLHWAPSRLIPCSCEYRKKWTRIALPPTAHGVQARLVLNYTYFRIDPDCLWHGDEWETFMSVPAEDVLDEDERRNH